MGERTDLENRLRWTDPFGEAGLFHAAVDVHDLEPLASKPGGVQYHEAGATGDGIRLRRRKRLEGERAVARPHDADLILKPLTGVRAQRLVFHGEASGSFRDGQRVDPRRVCSPVLIANEKGYAAKRLDAIERDIT